MRHMSLSARRKFLITFCLIFFEAIAARAVPVYLSPNSFYASGDYNREWLEGRTHARLLQRWMKVITRSGHVGWVPEDHLLSPLGLSTYALTTKAAALRAERRSESQAINNLPPHMPVRVISHQGTWVEVQPQGIGRSGFLSTDQLLPDFNSPQLAYVKKRSFVFEKPVIRSDSFRLLEVGERVEIVNQNQTPKPPVKTGSSAGPWASVKINTRQGIRVGFVERASLIFREEILPRHVLALRSNLPMRNDSVPSADTTYQARWLETLKVIDTRLELWGRVTLQRDGNVWWPMNDRASSSPIAQRKPIKLKTSEIFQRKIFDMGASPVVPQVKLASAQGIFRTEDGKEWARVEQFKDQDHPIAFSSGGRIFIGPYMSDDHGRTFRHYIRWDKLVGTLRDRNTTLPSNLRIVEVHPIDWFGRRIELKLDVGTDQKVLVSSDDLGQTWHRR